MPAVDGDSAPEMAAYHALCQSVGELYGERVESIDAAQITALSFLRDYVSQIKPVVIRGGAAHWPALRSWSNTALEALVGDGVVAVSVTPDGRADSVAATSDGQVRMLVLLLVVPVLVLVLLLLLLLLLLLPLLILELQHHQRCFAKPAEEPRALSALLRALQKRSAKSNASGVDGSGDVLYYQGQDDCFRQEGAFEALLPDIEVSGLPWATQAFGTEAEAVNIWIGGEASVT